MGRNAACLSFDTLQVSGCARVTVSYATSYTDYQVGTDLLPFNLQKFYESVLEQPIQESHKKSKREVVISGPLCKEGV